jgi:hypothetical protein
MFDEFLGAAPGAIPDVFGALCEAMPLAVVKSVRANADALQFHRAMAELGMAHNGGLPDQNHPGLPQSVASWLATGSYPAGAQYAMVSDEHWTDPAARAQALKDALAVIITAYKGIVSGTPPESDIHQRRRWDLAPDIVAYLEDLNNDIGVKAAPVIPT